MSLVNDKNFGGNLTPYKPGSIREAWTLMLPMILTATSMSLMLFFDRLILAQFSTKAMTAAASVGVIVAAIQCALMSIASIAETFVGQHNGAQDFKRVAEPVWQMIWFSLSTIIVTTPLAFFGADFLIADSFYELGAPYFKYLMLFSPLAPLYCALASFFIGLGSPKIVTIVMIIGNIVNISLDYILILGIEGWIEPMSTRGAAIATNIAFVIQCVILGYLFLRKQYRLKYQTNDFRLKVKPLIECLKIGTPSAVSHMIELGAWAVQMNMMARVSEIHITVIAIGQSIFLLFLFISDGMSKGIGAIASNYMGAKKYEIIPKTFISGLKIHFMIIACVLIIFALFHTQLIEAFIEGDYSPEALDKVVYFSKWALVWVWCFLLAEGVVWISVGILTAAGDTKFIMGVNSFNAWAFGILPLYLGVVLNDVSPAAAWFLVALYGAINMLTFLWRYRTGAWRINRVRKN